tara:strand:+ start:1243 stop:1392 length:150 start_codon:yes stop_codon:yes gene_type:complete
MAAQIPSLPWLLLFQHPLLIPMNPMLINRLAWGSRFKGCCQLVVSVAPL